MVRPEFLRVRGGNMNKVCSVSVLAGGAVLFGLAGCQTDPLSYHAIKSDLTPELQGLVERPVDVDRNLAVNNNQNLRMMSDDIGRLLYTDHPSMLSPLPVIYTSGNPR
jgi:hypothetical protein